MTNKPYFLYAAFVLFLLALLIIVGIQDTEDNSRIWNFEKAVALSIMVSIAASAIFFFIVEFFRFLFDRALSKELQKLKMLEETHGIEKIYLSKSEPEVINDYKSTISNAKKRIWALGLSNNQFVEQHLASIKDRMHKHNDLDVRVVFFDPDARVSRKEEIVDYPLVNLFDYPHNIYESNKREYDIYKFSKKITSDKEVQVKAYFALIPSYFSMMVVDDKVFFFPFLVLPEDASSNPVMVINANTKFGNRLVDHVEHLTSNSFLCKKL